MTPPTHYNFAEVLVGCFGYLLQPNKARRLSDLVGGVMTPPYCVYFLQERNYLKMAKIVTFGELMLRLQPFNYERFVQASTFEATFGDGSGRVQR